jgi:hypothetical protein
MDPYITDVVAAAIHAMNSSSVPVKRLNHGFLGAGYSDPKLDAASVYDTVKVPVTQVSKPSDTSPSMVMADPGRLAPTMIPVVMGYSKHVTFAVPHELAKAMLSAGVGAEIKDNPIAAAVEEVNADINSYFADIVAARAAWAVGTAGTIAFTTDAMTTLADALYYINANGGGAGDLQAVIGLREDAKLNATSNLYKVNEAGSSDVLLTGTVGTLMRFNLRPSAYVAIPASGGATGATLNGTAHALGSTTLTLAATGAGAILAGDVITIAGDTTQYVVASGLASVATGGTISLHSPGLRVAVGGVAAAITVKPTAARSAAFPRSALVTSIRPIATVDGMPDSSLFRTALQVPGVGAYTLAYYPGVDMGVWRVGAVAGAQVIRPEQVVHILGGAVA